MQCNVNVNANANANAAIHAVVILSPTPPTASPLPRSICSVIAPPIVDMEGPRCSVSRFHRVFKSLTATLQLILNHWVQRAQVIMIVVFSFSDSL
jgi:hypothetical protein